jgi:hypothetical protein
MLARKPRMLVTVALANKTARIVWALLAKGVMLPFGKVLIHSRCKLGSP